MNEYKFEPFQKVLGRDEEDDIWNADFFSYHRDSDLHPYACIGGIYRECIPYEGNEHLLGTTDSPTPGQRATT